MLIDEFDRAFVVVVVVGHVFFFFFSGCPSVVVSNQESCFVSIKSHTESFA